MPSPVRVTDSGDYLEVDLFFDRFADAKKFILAVAKRYGRNYMTGINMMVRHGQYFVIAFFDVSEVTRQSLEDNVAKLVRDFDYHIPDVRDDSFFMRVVKESEFNVMGDAEDIVRMIPDSWNIYG